MSKRGITIARTLTTCGATPQAEAIEMNMLGRKTGKGMFLYTPDKGPKPVNPEMQELIKKYSKPDAAPVAIDEIQLRMVSRFINEASYCLQDEIIASPMVGDMGSIFGIGFPPFRGGPFRFVDSYGAQRADVLLLF